MAYAGYFKSPWDTIVYYDEQGKHTDTGLSESQFYAQMGGAAGVNTGPVTPPNPQQGMMSPAPAPTSTTAPSQQQSSANSTVSLDSILRRNMTEDEVRGLLNTARYSGFDAMNGAGQTAPDTVMQTASQGIAAPFHVNLGDGKIALVSAEKNPDGSYKLDFGGIQGDPNYVINETNRLDAEWDAGFNRNLGLALGIAGGAYALNGSGLLGGSEVAGSGAGGTGMYDFGALNSFDTGAMASAMGYTPGMTMPFTAAMMSGAPSVGSSVVPAVGSAVAPAVTGATTAAGSTLGNLLSGIPGGMAGPLIGAGANLIGGALQNKTNRDIANQNNELIRQQNENAKFRPVGVTTRFGQSQFGYDANGRLTSAGYSLSPELKAMQDRQMGMLPQLQTDYERAAQLGRGAMKTPEQYMQEQLGLLSPTREQGLAAIRNNAQQTGRMGLATGGTSTTMATNPEMAAYYNAIQQENARLAANAPQQSLELANYGLGLMSSGYKPFATALGGAQNMESLGQGAMDLGTQLGAQVSTAGARLQTPTVPNQQNPFAYALRSFGEDQLRQNALDKYLGQSRVSTQNPYVPQQQQPYTPYTMGTDPNNPYSGGTEQWTGNSPWAWD